MAAVRQIETHRSTSEIVSSAQLHPERAPIYLLSCLAFLSQDQFVPALAACDRAVQSDPSDAQAFRLRGSIFLATGEPDRAVTDFSLAIQREPKYATGYQQRGKALLAINRPRAALNDFDRAVNLDPSDPDGFTARGWVYQSLAQYGRATQDFDRAIALAPGDAAGWNARCWVRVLANTQRTAALSDCFHALKLQPQNGNVLDSLGWVYLRMGRYRDAIGSFDAALEKSPKLASSVYGRGVAKLTLGDLKCGAADVATAKSLDPNIEYRIQGLGIPGHRATPPVPKSRPVIDGAS